MCFHSPSFKINRFLLYSLYFMNVFLRNSKNKNSAREISLGVMGVYVLLMIEEKERSARVGLMISNLILMTGTVIKIKISTTLYGHMKVSFQKKQHGRIRRIVCTRTFHTHNHSTNNQ